MAKLDTGTEDLLADLDAGVLTITLNRPDARNAMSDAMNQALGRQLAAAELDPAVKCVLLTGAGQGFCAGGDVKGMNARNSSGGRAATLDEAIATQRLNQRATAGKLLKMPKPTIAALPGAAAGAGLSLALACDLRIMARTAIMTTAFAKVGFSGDYGGTYFLTQLGERRRGPAAGPGQLGRRARGAGGQGARGGSAPGRRPDHRPALYEGEPQPCHGRRVG